MLRENEKAKKSNDDIELPISAEVGYRIPRLLQEVMDCDGHHDSEGHISHVLETSVLPFFGCCEFLVIYDRQSKKFLPIPDHVRNVNLGELVLPPASKPASEEWWIFPYQGASKGFVDDMGRDEFYHKVLEKVGYKLVATIDYSMYKQFDGTAEELLQYIKENLAQVVKANK